MTKEQIIAVLNEWNYWEKPFPDTFARPRYQKEIELKVSSGEILFIKGVRRSGKSTLLVNMIKKLMGAGADAKEILFVNLEDPRFVNDLGLPLLEAIKEAYLHYLNPGAKPYIFLDEIQNIDGFEKWLLKEYELKKSHLFATGSNSKLLSREIGSALSGRYLDVEMFGLDFGEFLSFKGLNVESKLKFIAKKTDIFRYFDEYLEYGGFPKVALMQEDELKRAELKSYFDLILLRDIVARYRLDNFRALEQLAVTLLSSVSNLVSLNALKTRLGLSYDALSRYIEYLENGYMIFRVPLFDWSLKKQQVNPKKVYAIDTGLINRVSFKVGRRVGDLLENIVFLNLRRMRKEIYYYKTSGGYEVDFLLKEKEKITHLIQVSANIDSSETRKREVRALVRAATELGFADEAGGLLLLTVGKNETVESEGKIIDIRNVVEWLLE